MLVVVTERIDHTSQQHPYSPASVRLQMRGRWKRKVAMESRLRTGPPSRLRYITLLAPTARSPRCAVGMPAGPKPYRLYIDL